MRLFFFQAEDGIRDYKVTGVQTCALPIYLVAVLVVDVLEAVQVDEAHHHAFLAARTPGDEPAQLIGEAAPVGQAGQRVQQGQRRQLPVGQIGRASWRERV